MVDYTIMSAPDVVRAFKRNTRLVEMHADGLTHQQSLIQTQYNINCMNWVVGHLVGGRRDLLDLLGAGLEPLPGIDRYARESDPIKGDGPDVKPLSELLALLADTYSSIRATLGPLSDDELAVASGEGGESLGDRVAFYYFHDTYHTGQVDLLRQISGMNDSII